jgi:stress response protein SCP2
VQRPNAALRHSGYQRDGMLDGDDESIDIDFGQLQLQCQPSVAAIALIVTCAIDENPDQDDFRAIHKASVRVRDPSTRGELHRADLPASTANNKHTACIVGICTMSTESANQWVLTPRQVMLTGPRNFDDAKEELREEVMGVLGINATVSALERGEDAVFDMVKGDVFSIPQNDFMTGTGGHVEAGTVRVGLGWTACGVMDLDVSAVCVDKAGKRVATVYFGNLNGTSSSSTFSLPMHTCMHDLIICCIIYYLCIYHHSCQRYPPQWGQSNRGRIRRR